MSELTEFFTQRESLERVSVESEELRAQRRILLSRARQKRHAADTLWIANQPSEALPLFIAAIELYRELVELDPDSTSDDGQRRPLAERLSQLGFRTTEAEHIVTAVTKASSAKVPALHESTGKDEIELQRVLDHAISVLDHHFDSLAATHRQLVTRRRLRILAAAVAAVVATFLIVYFILRPEPLAASASGVYANEPRFAPEKAVDRDPSTEWLLPDGQNGHLDVSLPKARAVRGVVLRNGHNPPYNDRAVQAYRVELYAGTQRVASTTGRFPRVDPNPAPVRVAIAGRGVDRVRFIVESHFGLGAAFADLDVE